MSETPIQFPRHKDHLNKTFLEEMNYKIWSTKGPRFNANKRLLAKDILSNRSIAFLSAYLIIFGLLSVYQISNAAIFNEKIIAFGSTTLSILILTFSQMEAAQDYKMRAHKHHDCALKLSELYNKIRVFKTFDEHTTDEKRDFSDKLSQDYQKVLEHYSNHESIDYELFQTQHADYYELKWHDIWRTKAKYYVKTKLLYHSLIMLPPFLSLVISFCLMKKI